MEENCKKIELKLSVGSICYEIFSNGDNTYNVIRTLYILGVRKTMKWESVGNKEIIRLKKYFIQFAKAADDSIRLAPHAFMLNFILAVQPYSHTSDCFCGNNVICKRIEYYAFAIHNLYQFLS